MKKENVLLIITNLGHGGAERSFAKLSNALSEHYNVVNVVFNDAEKNVYPLKGQLIDLEIKGGGNMLKKANNFILRICRLRQIKKKYSIAFSISFLEGADYVNLLSKRSEKVILSIRGSKYYDGNITGISGFLRHKILIPFLYRFADTIVVVNKGISWELKEKYRLKKTPQKVIHNFYDLDSIKKEGNDRVKRGFFQERELGSYFVISSRLAREKNIDLLIKVFASLKRKGYTGKLVIVGDGPELSKLVELCKNEALSFSLEENMLRVTGDVIFTGADSNPHKFVKDAMALLMASESEGFPNVVAEAMALSVPVICADTPWGCREIIHPSLNVKSGFLKEPFRGDYGILMPALTPDIQVIESWSEFLIKFDSNKTLRDHYREKSYERVVSFSKEEILEEWKMILT